MSEPTVTTEELAQECENAIAVVPHDFPTVRARLASAARRLRELSEALDMADWMRRELQMALPAIRHPFNRDAAESALNAYDKARRALGREGER